MKQIIALIIFIVLIYFVLLISTLKIEGFSFSNKMGRAFKGMMFMIPIVSLIGGVFFLLFELIIWILKLKIYFFDAFLIALYGVLIIFIGDFIIKISVLKFSSSFFAKKYGGENLNQETMNEIYDKNKFVLNVLNYVLMFVISFVLYFLILISLSVKINLIFLCLSSLTNLIFYKIFFRNQKNIQKWINNELTPL